MYLVYIRFVSAVIHECSISRVPALLTYLVLVHFFVFALCVWCREKSMFLVIGQLSYTLYSSGTKCLAQTCVDSG